MDSSATTIFASTGLAVISFLTLNAALDYLPVPTRYADKSRRHKWRNVVCATLHALIAAIGGIVSIYTSPELLHDHLNAYSSTVLISGTLSNGYFIYDFIDLLRHNKLRDIVAILAHHVLGSGFMFVIFFTKKFHGLIAISYLIEINGPFLHLRLILLMCGVQKSDLAFKVNAVINIVTYVVFRLGLFTYNTWWLVSNTGDVGYVLPFFAFTLLVMNAVLFRRLITSDYLSPKSGANAKQEDIMSD